MMTIESIQSSLLFVVVVVCFQIESNKMENRMYRMYGFVCEFCFYLLLVKLRINDMC